MPAARPARDQALEQLDTRALETLIGYDVRRASLVLTDVFAKRMAPLGVGPVAFTLLLLIAANPGITGSQLCALLDLRSSNLVGLVKQLTDRALVERRPHPRDVRALSLQLTDEGHRFTQKAYEVALAAGVEGTHGLSPDERATLARLLRKVYRT